MKNLFQKLRGGRCKHKETKHWSKITETLNRASRIKITLALHFVTRREIDMRYKIQKFRNITGRKYIVLIHTLQLTIQYPRAPRIATSTVPLDPVRFRSRSVGALIRSAIARAANLSMNPPVYWRTKS